MLVERVQIQDKCVKELNWSLVGLLPKEKKYEKEGMSIDWYWRVYNILRSTYISALWMIPYSNIESLTKQTLGIDDPRLFTNLV